MAGPRRRWLTYTLFGLLLIALLPFLVLCVVFCLKLFLAFLIILMVALLLIGGACVLYSAVWVLSRLASGRGRAAPAPPIVAPAHGGALLPEREASPSAA